MMNFTDPVDNNLLACGAFRCKTLHVPSIRIELQDEEIAILKRLLALGFSSNAEVIRFATLAMTDHAARLAAEGQAPLDPDGLIAAAVPTLTES
jgi:hypothetical protein